MLIIVLALDLWLGWGVVRDGLAVTQPKEDGQVRAFDDGTPPPPPRP